MSSVVTRISIISAACVCLALIPSAARADSPSNCAGADISPVATDLRQVESATLCLLNAERTSRGLVSLRSNARLRRAAVSHSADMVANHYFAHEDKSGRDPQDRIARAGYLPRYGPWVIGENLAWGTGYLATPREIVRAWMQSPPHRRNILYADFREIGVGVVPGVPAPTFGDGATYTTEFGATASGLQAARRHSHRHHSRTSGSGPRTARP